MINRKVTSECDHPGAEKFSVYAAASLAIYPSECHATTNFLEGNFCPGTVSGLTRIRGKSEFGF
jgi:hypothetical protein